MLKMFLSPKKLSNDVNIKRQYTVVDSKEQNDRVEPPNQQINKTKHSLINE